MRKIAILCVLFIIIILAIALLVLGPKRLPDLARSLGKGLAEFRRATADVTEELDEEAVLELERDAFMRLLRTPATQDRIEHMLETGKPLRN